MGRSVPFFLEKCDLRALELFLPFFFGMQGLAGLTEGKPVSPIQGFCYTRFNYGPSFASDP